MSEPTGKVATVSDRTGDITGRDAQAGSEIVGRPDRKVARPPRPARRPIEPVDVEATDVHAYLAVGPTGGIGWAGTDRDLAHRYAQAMGGVVARLPVVGDYREKPSDAGTVTP